MRWNRTLTVVAIAIGAVGCALFYDVLDRWIFATRSPIAANLPAEVEEANREFTHRIYSRFPIGSPEADLVSLLSAQGFERPDFLTVPFRKDSDNIQSAGTMGIFVLAPGPGINACFSSWSVVWQTDENKQIALIHAQYAPKCLF